MMRNTFDFRVKMIPKMAVGTSDDDGCQAKEIKVNLICCLPVNKSENS